MKCPSSCAVTKRHRSLANALSSIVILEIICTVIYVVPRTAFVGAILLSAYLGGAVVTHLRVGDRVVLAALEARVGHLDRTASRTRIKGLLRLAYACP